MERAFHDLQADKRLSGEWFDIEVPQATGLLCMYFDMAIALHVDEHNEDLVREIRERSGLNAPVTLHKRGSGRNEPLDPR